MSGQSSILPAAVFIAAALSASINPAAAQYGPFWGAPEPVDAPVTVVSSPSGTPLAHEPAWSPWNGADCWHAVYVKAGEVRHRVRGPQGWQPVETLTAGASNPHDPQIGFAAGRLHVIWVEERTGHSEVWTRSWDGTSWSPEQCLSDDAIPSTEAVIAGTATDALAAWQDSGSVHRAVRCRAWSGAAGWGPVAEISESPADAAYPTLIATLSGYLAGWSDSRNGNPEIYLRTRSESGWLPPVRATHMPGASAYPVLQKETCCGDYLNEWIVLLFQNDSRGVGEVWRCCLENDVPQAATFFSPDDGIPSTRPSLAGFLYELEAGPAYFTSIRSFATWSEADSSPGHPLRGLVTCTAPDDLGTFGASASSNAVIASYPSRPYAALANLWTEQRDGLPTLLFRAGTALSCWHVGWDLPARILLAPEGIPADTIGVLNTCEGTRPVPDVAVGLTFDYTLNNHLTWDQHQPHPDLPSVTTGDDGRAVFPIRGGGCSSTGTVSVTLNGITMRTLAGAVSPDINGDCVVGEDDLAYVESKLGSADFCADLDGSGHVDAADVAVVEATLGDGCSQTTQTGRDRLPRSAASALRLRIVPNPCPGAMVLRLELPEPGSVHARLVDAGGRLVRDLGERPLPAGVNLLSWNGRDDGGGVVPSGTYFVLVRALAQRTMNQARRTVFVVR